MQKFNKIFQAKTPTQKQDGRIYFTAHDTYFFTFPTTKNQATFHSFDLPT